jgi:ABC-type multidrug transport system fused ATPase/permease subunit
LLDGINLAVGAGEWVALEGPSGAGKTSLLDLVAGLYSPGTGRLLVDGARLDSERLPRWQRGLAYVGQDEMVFAASLRDNLGAGVDRVDPMLLEQALYISGLDRLVVGWPEGLDLPLADRGRRLSGGERQRVGIARALLRDPRLLILDEATAALDLAAEAQLFDRLRGLASTPALLIVSHRPQTLARCDRRVTIAGGKLLFMRDVAVG